MGGELIGLALVLVSIARPSLGVRPAVAAPAEQPAN